MRSFRLEFERNRWKLRGFLFLYFALALLAGRLAGAAVDPDLHYEDQDREAPLLSFGYPNRMALAFLLLAWVQYRRMRRGGGRSILSLVDARPLQDQRFGNTGREMALAAGIGAPRMYVVEDGSLNAFACGTREDGASVAVTRGLLERMSREEVQAVVAHEVAHIRNGDTKLMTLLFGLSRTFHFVSALALGPLGAAWQRMRDQKPMEASAAAPGRKWSVKEQVMLLLAMPLIALVGLAVCLFVSMTIVLMFVFLLRYFPWLVLAYALWDLFRKDRPARTDRSLVSNLALFAPVGLMVGPAILVLGLFVPFTLLLLRLAVSRNREFQADATAVDLTRNPRALLSALEKLRADEEAKGALSPALSMLTIAPMKRQLALLSTHPPLEERIARIAAMCADEPAERLFTAGV